MAMQVSKWNSPDEGPYVLHGRKTAFAKFSWETGDTYNASTHATTKPFNNGSASGGETKPLAGANPIDLFGIRRIKNIQFQGTGSSDADIPTGSVMPLWVRNGQYILLQPVGCTGTGGTLVAVDQAELTAVSGNLASLTFYGIIEEDDGT